jgi:hypothetical protein
VTAEDEEALSRHVERQQVMKLKNMYLLFETLVIILLQTAFKSLNDIS